MSEQSLDERQDWTRQTNLYEFVFKQIPEQNDRKRDRYCFYDRKNNWLHSELFSVYFLVAFKLFSSAPLTALKTISSYNITPTLRPS